MAKGRQQYFADEVSIQKEAREFAIEEQLKAKIDSVEEGAQVNVIETVKVNGEALIPDEEKAVDVDVPLVEDNLYSVDTEAALSARQGKVLYDYIQNLQSRGRYLSNWNSATGLPTTNPSESPYLYRAGDYFLVSNVSTGTNYKPDGSQYEIGVASETVETDTVMVSDMYIYDGSAWQLIKNGERPIVIDDRMDIASTNPVENRVITQALRTKQDTISDLQTIREGAAAGATAVQPGDNLSTLSGDSDDIVEGSSHLFMTTSERTKLGNQSGVNTGDETQATIIAKLGAASATTNGYLTAADWNTFNDKQDAIQDLQTIRENATAGKNASDTIATYGDIVTHDVNEFATAAQGAKADTALQSGDNVSELVNDAGYITDAYHDDTKQDALVAGDNITIENKCESDMKGPCPSGFHIPTANELEWLRDTLDALRIRSGEKLSEDLHMPLMGSIDYQGVVNDRGNRVDYWSTSLGDCCYEYCSQTLSIGSSYSIYMSSMFRNWGLAIRPFKDTYETPTSDWIVVEGTLGAAGVFYNPTDGLISITDGTDGYTISDKNCGATTVYNYGDTLTEANCGKFYQRGNNYGFSSFGTISTTSDLVDASNYGPGNYYSSDEFVVTDGNDRSTVQNDNLWGGVSQGEQCKLTISANDTTYVAGDFDIKDLADSTGKRAEWDAKQDALDLGANLSWGQDGKLNATDTTYTAGPGISISANNVISNTRTSAEWGNITGTLSDQTDLQSALDEKQNSFNIVDTLPDVSQADTNATYYLSTGDGKYEEWIVVEKELMTFVADPENPEDYIPYDVTFSSPKTLTFYNKTGNGRIEFFDPYGNYPHIIYGDAGEVITGGAEGWYYYDDNLGGFAYADASTYTVPAGTYTMISNGSFSTCYDTVSFIEGLGPTTKEWVKVGAIVEPEPPFIVVDTLPPAATADMDKIYIVGPIGEGADKYEEWIATDVYPGALESDTEITIMPVSVSFTDESDERLLGLNNVYLAIDNLSTNDITNVNLYDGSTSSIECDLMQEDMPYIANGVKANPGIQATMGCYGEAEYSLDVYSSASAIYRNPQGGTPTREWKKIGETSPDLSNVKVFYLDGTTGSDNVAAAQAAADWYNNGNLPILYWSQTGVSWGGTYILQNGGQALSFCKYDVLDQTQSSTPTEIREFYIVVTTNDSGVVTNIRRGSYNERVLVTNNTRSYTPSGDYNPATKKYVDDAISGITPGQAYTAGDGIDITNNEISADNTIARADDINTKTFYIPGFGNSAAIQAAAQEAYDWYKAGKNPLIVIDGVVYTTTGIGDNTRLWFTNRYKPLNGTSSTKWYTCGAGFEISSGNVVSVFDTGVGEVGQSSFLRTDYNYPTPYTPLYDGSPATKKYVDDKTPIISATEPTGTEGALWYDTTNDVLMAYNGTAWKEAGTQMKVLSYGHSTWQDFLDAYNENAIVYCRASSQSNPGTGNQGRMAFMAFIDINNSTGVIQSVEFQYYRSRSDHNTSANQLDEVYVYKLTSGGAWTVTQRNTAAKAVAGTGISLTFGSGNMTIANTGVTSFNGDTGAITLTPGTYLSLNNNVIDVDTSLIATKADIANFAGFLVVAQLPTTDIKTDIIYLLGPVGTGADKYEEYIYSNNNWIMIGDTSIDLSPYFHKTNDDSDDIIEGSTNLFLTSAERTKLGNTSGTNTGDETKTSIQTKLGAASSSNSGYLTSTDYDTIMSSLSGGGDMSYSDFNWQAKTGATVTLDLASTITPSANFTVNAPSTIKDGQTYILRVSNGATAYTMTLGTNVTNPYSVDTTLTASGIDQFVFLAIGGNLELQPDVSGGGDESNTKTFFLSSTSDLTTAQAAYDWLQDDKSPIIIYDNQSYILYSKSSNMVFFRGTGITNSDDDSLGYSRLVISSLRFSITSGEVTEILASNAVSNGAYLRPGANYSTPYTPQYAGSPATKKYVDDNDTVISGDSGVKYTIKVSNTAPASGTASNIITIVTN